MAPGITTAAAFSVAATVNPEYLMGVTIQVDFPRVLWPNVVLTCQNAAAQCEQWPQSTSQPAVDPSGHSEQHLGERPVVASLHSLWAWNSRLTRECTQHTSLPQTASDLLVLYVYPCVFPCCLLAGAAITCDSPVFTEDDLAQDTLALGCQLGDMNALSNAAQCTLTYTTPPTPEALATLIADGPLNTIIGVVTYLPFLFETIVEDESNNAAVTCAVA